MAQTGTGRLGGIEALRGVAASLVVLYHAARHLNFEYGMPMLMSLFQFGHAGVDVFFVISGFIILYVHEGDIGRPDRVGHYLNRRFTRVWPTYWVALAMTLGLSLAGGHGWPGWWQSVVSLTLLPSNTEPLLGVAWTLQFEFGFYAVFAVLIASRAAGLALMAAWVAWIAAGLAGAAQGIGPRSLHDVSNLQFLLGMAIAFTVRRVAVPAPRAVLAAGVALFAMAAVAENAGWMDGYARIARLAYGVPSGLMILGAAAADRQGKLALPGWLAVLGSASYSIYLFQFICIGVTWKLWLASGLDRLAPHAASWPLLALSGIIGGIVASRLVEYPLMRLMRRARA